jgi:hypothetical protein
MVAMGTSLADRAWGRESASYRIAGVINVIAGWFVTAIVAFMSAAIMALILINLKIIGLIIVCGIVVATILIHYLQEQNQTIKNPGDTSGHANA